MWWVGRNKLGMVYDLLDEHEVSGDIIEDHEVMLNENVHARRITAWVEVNGQRRQMTFLSNHLQWSAPTICDLYKARWEIEVFFKQIKQTLKLGDFLGHSANAVRWQVWSALLVYVLLRFLSRTSQWAHSFTRLFAIVRAGLWKKFDLMKLLRERYGTAEGGFRNITQPEQAYFPGY